MISNDKKVLKLNSWTRESIIFDTFDTRVEGSEVNLTDQDCENLVFEAKHNSKCLNSKSK